MERLSLRIHKQGRAGQVSSTTGRNSIRRNSSSRLGTSRVLRFSVLRVLPRAFSLQALMATNMTSHSNSDGKNNVQNQNGNRSGGRSRHNRQPQHRLIGFGSNYFHALGGSTEVSLDAVPAREYLDGFDVQQLCCTTTSSMILTKSGKIYQVGMLHGLLREKPQRVPFNERIVQLAGGRHFCLARSESGLVASWGAGHFGQLGHGPNVSLLERPHVISHLMPQVTGESPIISIECGAWHGAALLQDGRLYTWGSNRRNQCGFQAPSTIVFPEVVEGRYSQIACGKGHTVALEKGTGRVFTWGSSVGCGHSSRRTAVPTPRLLEALQRVVIVSVAAGDSHSLALTGGGRVFSWGLGPEGQLGMGGAFSIIPRPKLVGDLDFVAIVAGQQLAEVSSNGIVRQAPNEDECEKDYAQAAESAATLDASVRSDSIRRWSLDQSGATGPIDASKQASREQGQLASHILANVPKVTSIHAVGCYSLAVSSSGHVYAWGYNDPGTLGLPHCSELPVMEAVSNAATIAQIKSRTLEAQSFDSRHNVLLPKRVDALSDLNIELLAGGPSHLLVYGKVRDPDQIPTIGRTLHEVQRARRLSMSVSLRNDDDDISTNSAETDAVTMATDAMSFTTNLNVTPDSRAALDLSSPLAISPESNTTRSQALVQMTAPGAPLSQKKTRTSSVSKFMQRLSIGSEKKKNGEPSSRPSIGRVFSAAFGSGSK